MLHKSKVSKDLYVNDAVTDYMCKIIVMGKYSHTDKIHLHCMIRGFNRNLTGVIKIAVKVITLYKEEKITFIMELKSDEL